MGVLKEDQSIKNSLLGKLSSILSELGDLDSKEAEEFVTWCLDKSKLFKKGKLKERFSNLPYQMQRGDIVRVKFGINIGDEFSDSGTDGHFAIYWAQNGFQIIVIPISAEERQKSINDFAINIGVIPGLPKNTDTYAKIDMIESVNLRRISRIADLPDGKISLSNIKPEIITQIYEKLNEKFLK